jgi:hypothetical protein
MVSQGGCGGMCSRENFLVRTMADFLISVQAAEASVQVWSADVYTKIEEYAEVQERLKNSLSRHIVWFESVRNRLLQESLPPVQVSAIREQVQAMLKKDSE